MDGQLVAIFDQCIELEEPTNAVVKYSDGNAYLERKRGSNKPLPPSQEAVKQFYQGNGATKVFTTFVGRSILIGGALAMFGDNKNQKSLVKNSLIASASIEAFLFYWYSVKNK